jgi:hypothetical protein
MRLGIALSLPLLIGILAGCVGGDGSDDDGTTAPPMDAAALVCLDGVCNFQATVTPEARQANELSIAVNPTDPMNILATGKDYTPEHAGDCVWDGIYTTKDGGLTWTNANIPGSPWYLSNNPGAEPHEEFSKFWCATDPVVAFGPDGTAYWTVMPYQCDRLSGSKTGRDALPQGGFNDWFWTCSSMYVLVSEDGGETWPIVREVAFGPRLEHDKQWITVAPNGNVLLCWDRSDQVQDDGTPVSQLRPQGDMVCSVSTDKGRTWAEWQPVNPGWPGFLPWIDYDANNTAWLAALDGQNILVSRSDDGLVWDDPVTVGNYTDPPPGGEYGWPVIEGSDFRIFALPTLAVDRTAGPYGGSIYVAWFDHTPGYGRIAFTYSRDQGATWSDVVYVRDDAPNHEHDQFMPAIGVGPDGTVDLSWYDRRQDPENHLFDLYYAYSADGGRSFSQNLRVSEVSSDEQYSHHQNGMVFMGDYLDIDSSFGKAHVVWVDTRNQKADAFIAHVERPGANAEG